MQQRLRALGIGLEVLTYDEWKERHEVEQEVAAAEAAAEAATIAAAVAGGGRPVVVGGGGSVHTGGEGGRSFLCVSACQRARIFLFLVICCLGDNNIPSPSHLVFFLFFLFFYPLPPASSTNLLLVCQRHSPFTPTNGGLWVHLGCCWDVVGWTLRDGEDRQRRFR